MEAVQRKRAKESGDLDAESENTRYKPNSGEFLSGFWKTDKLIPSITLTIHFGTEPWDGPMSLFDMLSVKNKEILACMDNYHLRLISPALMTDEEIGKFQSSLREVMLFIKYSKDRKVLQEMLAQNNDRFKDLEPRAADVIAAVTNIKLPENNEGKETVDMCQAVQEMCDESEAIGRAKGRAEGRVEGRAEGRAEGKTEGELLKAQEIAKNLHAMGIRIEQIAQGVGSPVETVKQWLGI